MKSKGRKFFLFLGDLYGPSYHLMHWGVESYEAQNQKVVSRILSNGDVFLDIGANIGIYSLLAAQQGAATRVYSFDPEQRSRDCLEAGIEANNLKNIRVFSSALSDKEGDGVFFLDANNHGGSSLNEESIDLHSSKSVEKVSVRLTTVDIFVKEQNLEKVDLIKVDVQEHEFEVLSGAQKTIEKFKPIVLVECNAVNIGTEKDPFKFFDAKSYSVFEPKTEKVFSVEEASRYLKKKNLESGQYYSDFFFFPNEKINLIKNDRPHLVFLAEHLSYGGAERALIEYLSCIDKSKYKCSLVLRDGRGDNYLLDSVPPDIEANIVYPEAESLGVIRSCIKKKLPKLDLTFRFKSLFERLPENSIILDFTSVLLKQAFYFKKFKKIYWIHGPKSQMDELELQKFALRLRSYDLIIAVSEHLKEELQNLLPALKDRVVRLYNPFDVHRIRESAKDENELSDKDRELLRNKFILAVGRFAVEKDFITLVKAYGILKKRSDAPKLYIVGDGPKRSEIEKEIFREGLQRDIVLLGARKNPYIWMKNAQFFVHSAFLEGFGLVLVEAMALGRAVIVTDSPVGPREVLENGKYGILVPVGEPDRLAEGMGKLLQDPQLLKKYEELSLDRVHEFDEKNTLKVFDRAIARISVSSPG